MNDLKSVIDNRLRTKLENGAAKAQKFVTEMMQEVTNQRDFIVKPTAEDGGIDFGTGEQRLTLQRRGHEKVFDLHPHALNQIGEKFGIPTAYLNKLAENDGEHKELAVEILNYHRGWAKDSNLYLVRSVMDEIKGFLSNSYMRMNSAMVLNSFLVSMQENDAQIADCYNGGTRYWAEALIPQTIPVPTEKNGIIYLAFGTRIGNSDYGDGALDIRSFMMQPVCANGMVRESLMNRVHLGKRLTENVAISAETYRKESEMIAGAVRDITKYSLNIDTIKENIALVQRAGNEPVTLEREFLALATKGMSKGEIGELQNVMQQNSPDDGVNGEATLWKLTQGITAVGRNIGERRERELAQLAGELLAR